MQADAGQACKVDVKAGLYAAGWIAKQEQASRLQKPEGGGTLREYSRCCHGDSADPRVTPHGRREVLPPKCWCQALAANMSKLVDEH